MKAVLKAFAFGFATGVLALAIFGDRMGWEWAPSHDTARGSPNDGSGGDQGSPSDRDSASGRHQGTIGAGFGGNLVRPIPDSRSPNDQRSDVLNPNNSAYHAATDNRSNQLNPNNPAYYSSRGKSR